MWDAGRYLNYSKERSRPFYDLLARVNLDTAASIADLGCGPGHLTRVLADRWPHARIIGVDSSPEMLTKARQVSVPDRLAFVQADLASWPAPGPLDLIVSNAALQWVGDHERLLARLAGMLAPAGVLAVQVPAHFDDPAYQAIAETATRPRWDAVLRGVGLRQDSVLPLPRYVQCLHDIGLAVDAWQTTYIHVLTGDNPVLEWFRGSALTPLLARLDTADRATFLGEVGEQLRAAYPPRAGVTLFPFTRLFFVAVVP